MSGPRRSPQRKQDPLSRIITLGDIDNENACEVIGIINEIQREDKAKEEDKREPIKLILNSCGGSVYDGFGIIDTIESSLTPVHIYIQGQAMSMAFAIATCGHYRCASKRSTFMYHEMLWETAPEKLKYHEQELKEGKRISQIYDEIVVENTNIPLKTLQKVCNERKEWYMNAEEALKLGVIDEII